MLVQYVIILNTVGNSNVLCYNIMLAMMSLGDSVNGGERDLSSPVARESGILAISQLKKILRLTWEDVTS